MIKSLPRRRESNIYLKSLDTRLGLGFLRCFTASFRGVVRGYDDRGLNQAVPGCIMV